MSYFTLGPLIPGRLSTLAEYLLRNAKLMRISRGKGNDAGPFRNQMVFTRGTLAERRTDRQHFPYDSDELHCADRDSRTSDDADDGAAVEVVRHQPPHLLCFPLPAPLVRSVESEVVCRVLADDLSAASTAVDRRSVAHFWPRHGLHGG